MSKAERTRQFIIEKAAPVFNHKGIAGTSMSDLMEATQLTKGGIYGNFDSKEEICLEAFKFLIEQVRLGIDQQLQHKNNAQQKLIAVMDFYKSIALDQEFGGCPIINFGTEVDDTNPTMKQCVGQAIDNIQTRIQHIVESGIKTNEFKPTIEAKTFAVKMFAMLEGALLLSRVQNSLQPMRIITNQLKAEIESWIN